MLFPLPSLLCWYLWCLLKMYSGFAKTQAIRQSIGTLLCPPATLHCRTACSVVPPDEQRQHRSSPRCTSQPSTAAWFHSTLYSRCASGMSKAPGSIKVSKPPQAPAPFVSPSQESEWCRKGVLGKRSTEDAARQSCSSFRGAWGGKTCWCCLSHRGWSRFRSGLALQNPTPLDCLYFTRLTCIHWQGARIERQLITYTATNIEGLENSAHKEQCNSPLHGAFYCISWW